MREILADVLAWGDAPIAIATVVATWGSAPRAVGAKMALAPEHRISGSVSGGCVEGAVYEAGLEVVASGRPRLLRFGVSDETALEAVGLACGGTIEVFVEPLTEALRDLWTRAAREDAAIATATVVDGPLIGMQALAPGAAPSDGPRAALRALAGDALASGATRRARLAVADVAEPLDVFVEAVLPAPTLMLIGGVHIAVALVPLAQRLGFRTVVIDPREAFGNRARFPTADVLASDWPDKAFARHPITRGTAVVALTHDEKFDDPALKIALRSEAFYVGALGGKVTREKRLRRLAAAGFGAHELSRLRQPIGLDIGARTPEEIALATLAQIVAARNGRP